MEEDRDFWRRIYAGDIQPKGPVASPTGRNGYAGPHKPVVGTTEVSEDGIRVTVVTRPDGSRFKVTVLPGATQNRKLDPKPRKKYAIKIENLGPAAEC